MKEIAIEGIWLRRIGAESDPSPSVTVKVQIGGKWIEVIREPLAANFSHCVSPSGIRETMKL